MRVVGKFAGNVASGAAQEAFSQVAFGRSAPMTGPASIGGGLGSLMVKSMVGEVKGAMKPNFGGFSKFDKVAMKQSPLLMSNQARQQLQGQGFLNSRDVGAQQRNFEMFKSGSPAKFEEHSAGIKAEVMGVKKERD